MTPVDDIPNWPKLRKAHFNQLMNCLLDKENTGWYYGNKKQFEKRHGELKEWVESIINMFDR